MAVVRPEWIASAQAAQRVYPAALACVSLAQLILETGWGANTPCEKDSAGNVTKVSNNFFGIKAVAGQDSVLAPTHEVLNGVRVPCLGQFAAYPNTDGSFLAHAKLLATGQYTAKARAALPDKHKYCLALGGGTPQDPRYSTDSEYGETLWKIITYRNLAQYDV